jgi:hypothetical protein
VSNLYVAFENIDNHCGVLLNIKNHQKLLLEINGLLKIIELENGALKLNNSFTDFNKEGCENGFISYDNGKLKLWRLPLGYQLTEVGLLKRNPLHRFPVNCNALPLRNPNAPYMQFYWYFLIEKELRQVVVNGMVFNKFIYYLTFRTEE